MTDTVLIVEDDDDIAELISVNLAELAIKTHHESNGQSALELALSNEYDLILLDVMLPGVSGLDICRQVRDKKPHQAIMMLTSRNSETDRVVGLELGADDYMTKPFNVRELQARVRSQLRRVQVINELKQSNNVIITDKAVTEHEEEQNQSKSEVNNQPDALALKVTGTSLDLPKGEQDDGGGISIGNLNINSKTHVAQISGQQLDLTSTEFELLNFFAANPEQVFSRAQLLDTVWGYHHSGYEHTVNSHINRLRSKLEADVSNPKIIQTVWGVGYKFNPQGVS